MGIQGHNPFSRISTSVLGVNWMASGLSTIFSTISFFILKALNVVAAFPGLFILASVLGIVASFIFWSKKEVARWVVFSVSIVMLVLTSWQMNRNENENKKANQAELIADATDAGISLLTEPKIEKMVRDSISWFLPAVMEDQMMYVLIPSNLSPQAIGRNALDPKKIEVDSPGLEMRMIAPNYKVMGESLDGEYLFAGFYKPHLRDGYEFKRCKVLPESVAITIKAVALTRSDTRAAKKLFEKADSMHNAVAADQIAVMYSRGVAVNRDVEEALRITKRAANEGSRRSRLTYGRLMLLDSTYSTYDKAVAEKMLKRVALVSTVVSKTISDYSEQATDLLCEYYWSTGRYEDSYRLTKQSTESYQNPNIIYFNHLYNCIYTDRVEEAKSLIADGEKAGNPSAYAMHGEMIRRGFGYEKDYSKAQELVGEAIRAAVGLRQPLHGSLPRLFDLMATVLEDASDSTGAHFWKRLAEINFNTRIDDE